MTIDIEETIELIEMHGRTIIDSCICDHCHGPDRMLMLKKLDRMRELIMTLPEHLDVEFEAEGRTAH